MTGSLGSDLPIIAANTYEHELRWVLHWESDLSESDHRLLTRLLADIYPAHTARFKEACSWSGAQPEGRIVGYQGEHAVAHLGFVRRILRTEANEIGILTADVGLVGIRSDLQGKGVGRKLLHQIANVFKSLNIPYAFLTCREAVVPFYESGGWVRLLDSKVKMIDNHYQPELYTGPAMILPSAVPFEQWPHGETIIRDGLEV
ncbi:GNAT family N-acetyltransferase [Paenibacillus taichungensis]|uniref:GNAT family N-acetyltransferase n=1 Tax=Paenibacillus taichungensis TaxID=484184 RepID=UPI0039A6D13B